ncbi:NUDIX hydrolase [Luteimonas sp. R10]|uniref:NUDIX hydrolase n=1 Tax=Luteimonas sp. R10 TaxID=3108176 RepID=UPI003088E15D|nr:NUDIX domain-containing protein [Luteimonas sp. R10]
MPAIDKVAWIHIEAGRVLCVRSHGKGAFYLPGGKREPGESDEACVQREVREELGVSLRAATLRAAGTFQAQAHGKPEGTQVRMACYAADYDGTLRADAEIAEFAWLAHRDRDRCSPVARIILDALHRRGEIA